MFKMGNGRQRNLETRMKVTLMLTKLIHLYLPIKCYYTDKLITPKDYVSTKLTKTFFTLSKRFYKWTSMASGYIDI